MKGSVIASVPGKLILMGEHAAVYQRPAVVAAVGMRSRVELEAAEQGVMLDLPDLDDLVTKAVSSEERIDLDDALRAYRDEPVNRYRSFEGELNRIGYQFLGEQNLEAAVRLFELNVELHPSYANGFDSLGEALQTTHDLEGAAKAFRRALILDPNLTDTAAKLGQVEHLLERR